MIGRVISAKSPKTVTVIIERSTTHPLYKKSYTRSKKYLVDDTVGCKEGDIVEILKIKPVSKNKHWKVVQVIGKDLAEIIEAKQKKAAEEAISEVMPEDKPEEKVEEIDKQEVVKEKVKKVKKEKK